MYEATHGISNYNAVTAFISSIASSYCADIYYIIVMLICTIVINVMSCAVDVLSAFVHYQLNLSIRLSQPSDNLVG